MKAPSQAPIQSLGVPPGERDGELGPAITLLVLFAILGLVHLALFIVNRRRGHWFVFSALLFVLAALRIAALVLRLCWSWDPGNSRLALSAQLFVACGTVIPTVVNLFFAQRLIRSQHPQVGWSTPLKVLMPGLPIATTISMIIALLTSLIISFYTHNPHTLSALRKIQQAGLAWFVFATLLPTLAATTATALNGTTAPDPFGSGTTRAQTSLLCATSTLQAAGAALRLASASLPPAPLSAATPWYLSRAAFYAATFAPDLATLALYGLFRADRRFHVPDGAGAPGSYSAELVFEGGRAVGVRRVWPAEGQDLGGVEPRVLAVDLRTGRYRLLGAVVQAREGVY